ncbi:MAG: hypothetical protein ACPGYV_01310 [Phycisphaeraceae bacterium]
MKPLRHCGRWLGVLVMLIASACVQKTDDAPSTTLQAAPPPLPAKEKIEADLYDTTARWQDRFGIEGKLTIESGRLDLRAAAADGDAVMLMYTKPLVPGLYIFVFVKVDELEMPNQIHAAHLYVQEDPTNRRPPTLRPDRHKRFATVGMPVAVVWTYNPGGEGIPNGWRLAEVVYHGSVSTENPITIPGYNYPGGE